MKLAVFATLLFRSLIVLFITVNLAYGGVVQKPSVKSLTSAEIQQRIQSIKDRQNLTDEIKNRILADYYECEDNLGEAEAQDLQAETFKRSLAQLPLEAKQIQRQIIEAENALKNRKTDKFSTVPTDELEQRQIIEKTRLSDLDAEIARSEAQINDLVNRPQAIRERIAEVKAKQLATSQEQQELLARTGNNLVEKEATQTMLDSRIRLANSSLKALELENISAPNRLQLQKDRVHLLSLQRELLSLLIADLDNFLLDRRQQEIDKEQAALALAEKEAEGKHPLIRAATKENMRYNQNLQEVTKNTEQYLLQKTEIEARYKQLDKDFQSAEQKINLAGLSPVLGNLLREQRRNLPQREQFASLNENIQREIALASLESFRLDEAKKQLSDINQTLLARMSQLNGLTESDKLRLRTELRMLLNDQKDLVVRLAVVYAEYTRILGDVDFNLQQMLTSADKFGAYLDERLLWVPSAPVISEDYLQDIFHSLQWFLRPANWATLVGDIGHSVVSAPWVMVVALVLAGLHWHYRKPVKLALQSLLNKNGNNPYTSTFAQLLRGLVGILWLSLPVPLLMVWTAWVLNLNHSAAGFSRSVADGLAATALSMTVVHFFYRVFKPEGVAEVLFLWQQHNARLIYRQLQWSRFIVLPCIFLIAMTGSDLFSAHSYALGRTGQIIMMLTLAYVLHRLCHPTGLGKSFYRNSQGWITRLRYLWYLVAVVAPLVIIGFAVAGYYQSALELQGKLIASLRLFIVIALFHALAVRWLAVTKRQLALQNARQKRKLADQPVSSGEGVYPQDDNLHDLSKINQQSNKLLNTIIGVTLLVGFWMIWSDILPAFSVLQRVELWQYAESLDGKETLTPVTLINVLLCLLYAGLAAVFVGNFPALVDLLSVGKFAMTAGSRYALIQLMRYSFVSITFLAIANELGGSWSQVQWLVAALSVGLGFGLQEIFANMVSGIILLFERPIRVGDTVTVGNVTGRVSQIQMRATHIVDWDRKELVVPNKVFITDQLINWTLSDTVTRVVMPIGVGYGTDTELVEQILKDSIKQTDLVLDDPEPSVTFIGFGESSLDFKVNVFVRELSDRVPVTHELHKKIYAAFCQHHIEVPYPQRDVHIRSVAAGIMKS